MSRGCHCTRGLEISRLVPFRHDATPTVWPCILVQTSLEGKRQEIVSNSLEPFKDYFITHLLVTIFLCYYDSLLQVQTETNYVYIQIHI